MNMKIVAFAIGAIMALACAEHKPPGTPQPSTISISCSVLPNSESRICGTVIDSVQQPVIGAIIKVVSKGSKFKQNAITDIEGNFTLADIPEGIYTIRVEAQGYTIALTEGYYIQQATAYQLLCTMGENGEWIVDTFMEPHIDLRSPSAREVIYIEGESVPRVETR